MPSKSTTVRYLFDLILYVPVNKFSVTSTKQGLMCLSRGHNAVTPMPRGSNPQSLSLESSTLPLSHCTPIPSDILLPSALGPGQ